MRRIDPKWIFAAVLLMAAPLGAGERTGILAPPRVRHEQEAALKALKAGNRYFLRHMTGHHGNPVIMVVSCADAHVPPETIFHMKPGELYTNRAFGNVVDKVILGSLEYGVQQLGCKVLVVLGHTGCTAVRGAMSEYNHPRTEWDSLNQEALYKEIEPAVAQVEETQSQVEAQTGHGLKGDALIEAVVRANVLNTIHSIEQKSPILWDLEQKDLLRIVGCIYNKSTGKVEWIKD